MQNFTHFIINHWPLWLALLAIIALLIMEETKTSVGGIKKLTAQQAVNLINHDNAVVVDIRETAEFQNGHILDAINIPFSTINEHTSRLTKYKNKPILLVCAAEGRALKAGVTLRKAGFNSLYVLKGGMTVWQRESFPTTK